MTLRAPGVETGGEWGRQDAMFYVEPAYLQTALLYDGAESHPCLNTIPFPDAQIREPEAKRLEETAATREAQ